MSAWRLQGVMDALERWKGTCEVDGQVERNVIRWIVAELSGDPYRPSGAAAGWVGGEFPANYWIARSPIIAEIDSTRRERVVITYTIFQSNQTIVVDQISQLREPI